MNQKILTTVFIFASVLISNTLSASYLIQITDSKTIEYGQFISKADVFQWIEGDVLLTADSQQALLRKMGKEKATEGIFINDLIVLNFLNTQGWELISVVSPAPNTLVYTFKRPTENSD